jgi:KTSC domain
MTEATPSDDPLAGTRFAVMTRALLPHVGMAIIVPPPPSTPADIISNGTMTFVDTGTKKLLITCDHVFREFEYRRQEVPGTRLAITGANGGVADVSDATLIDIDDKHLDVAILESPSGSDRVAAIGKQYFAITSWPAVPPSRGEEVGIVGFPAIWRAASHRGLEVPFLRILEPAASVSPLIYGMDIPDDLAAVIYAAQPYDAFTSSNIASFSSHIDADTLIVHFHGGRFYAYSNVPPGVVVDFCRAPSKGRFHAAHIKWTCNLQQDHTKQNEYEDSVAKLSVAKPYFVHLFGRLPQPRPLLVQVQRV